MNHRIFIPLVLLALGLSACGSKQRTGDATPPDYVAIVATSISGGAAISEVFASQAIEAENWRACVAAEVISEASQSAVAALLDYGNEIPAIEVDVSDCLALNPNFSPGEEDDALSQTITVLTTSVLETAQLLIERELTDADQCTTRAYVVGALDYVQGSTLPIVNEVVSPDGMIAIPAVSFDFSACAEASE